MTMTKRQRWVLALTSTASLMILLDGLVVTTALHAIALDLHASIADLEWTVNAYTLRCRAGHGRRGPGRT
ncbi:MAG: hypothetical protein JWN52_1427, partial [Actinomycetia bacterium]|nr:hypothetical protein [Actinomycetes bacterium]